MIEIITLLLIVYLSSREHFPDSHAEILLNRVTFIEYYSTLFQQCYFLLAMDYIRSRPVVCLTWFGILLRLLEFREQHLATEPRMVLLQIYPRVHSSFLECPRHYLFLELRVMVMPTYFNTKQQSIEK